MLSRRTLDMINAFEKMFPSLVEEIVECYQSGKWELTLIDREGNKMYFNYLNKTIRAIKKTNCSEEVWRNNFSIRLKKRLQQLGMSQRYLSEATGISAVSLSKYVNGRSIPDSYSLLKIANVLECTTSELVDFDI